MMFAPTKTMDIFTAPSFLGEKFWKLSWRRDENMKGEEPQKVFGDVPFAHRGQEKPLPCSPSRISNPCAVSIPDGQWHVLGWVAQPSAVNFWIFYGIMEG